MLSSRPAPLFHTFPIGICFVVCLALVCMLIVPVVCGSVGVSAGVCVVGFKKLTWRFPLLFLLFFCRPQNWDKNYYRFLPTPSLWLTKRDRCFNCTVYEKINIRSRPTFFFTFSFTTCVISVLVLFHSLILSLSRARTHTHTPAVRDCQ